MTVIVCLDDKDGMLFNGRRQSADRVLCRHMEQQIGNGRLFVTPYSAKLFSSDKVTVSENPMDEAGADDCCFIEDLDVAPFLKKAEKLVIYRWNRTYPSDVKFPHHGRTGWRKIKSEEFPGNSHERITLEVYTR